MPDATTRRLSAAERADMLARGYNVPKGLSVTVCPPRTFGIGYVPIGWKRQNSVAIAKREAQLRENRQRLGKRAQERAEKMDRVYREHFEAGGDVDQLAQKLGVQPRTVRERANKRGIAMPDHKPKPRTWLTPDERDRILSLLSRGQSIRCVAEATGRDARTVRRVRDEAAGVGRALNA